MVFLIKIFGSPWNTVFMKSLLIGKLYKRLPHNQVGSKVGVLKMIYCQGKCERNWAVAEYDFLVPTSKEDRGESNSAFQASTFPFSNSIWIFNTLSDCPPKTLSYTKPPFNGLKFLAEMGFLNTMQGGGR